MKTIICSRLEFIPSSKVEFNSSGEPVLLSDENFQELIPEGQIEYSSESSSPDAGPIRTETVKVKSWSSNASFLLSTRLLYFVIRMYSSDGIFYVGSPEYPAQMKFTDDKRFANITFSAVTPL